MPNQRSAYHCGDETLTKQQGALADTEGAKTLVIKIGTSSLMHDHNKQINLKNISALVETIADLKGLGHKVVLVTSGGVGVGCSHLGFAERPKNPVTKQALAAVGNCRLSRLYDDLFALRGINVGLILVTRTDLVDRVRYLNLRNTVVEMLELGLVPIVNENDAVAAQTLKFGDNDTLAAYIAIGMNAKWLFLLTDVDFLYTANPRQNKGAKPIVYVETLNDVYSVLDEDQNEGTQWGSGGMMTKVIAAKLAGATGVSTTLINGCYPERIIGVLSFAANARVKDTDLTGLIDYKQYHGGARTTRIRSRSRSGQNEEDSNNSSPAKLDKSFLFDAIVLEETLMDEETTNSLVGNVATVSEKSNGDSKSKGLITIETDQIQSWPYTGTIFGAHPMDQTVRDQRRWILSLPPRGRIYVDEGCARSLMFRKKSLFPVGILAVEGVFQEGEAVSIYRGLSEFGCSTEGESEFARALVNVRTEVLTRIKGQRTADFKDKEEMEWDEVAHRSNICFVGSNHRA
ncbi:MAG: uncharacterized protein KVP18_004771 [Porospora cf. gigantea A]|uniref:uncharacterized protein n=1 Tax=Porospora cf. gigantea A TaxID=2853593 RepID=UPI0035594807|nr:MAG: hypothetical protein KVP18_004771 [Porospora cf. gigantea A]